MASGGVNQAERVRLRQRVADLVQNMHHPPLRQRPVLRNQIVEVQAPQKFHGVIKDPVGGVTVIENLDGVGVRELAGKTNLALKARNGGGIRAFGQKQFYRRIPSQQRMPCAVHHAHAAGPDFFFERVLSQLF